MRILWFACLALAFTTCDSSSEKTTAEEKEKKDTSISEPSETFVSPLELAVPDIPKTIKFRGKVQDAWQWIDKSGENIFFTSVVAPYNDNDKGEAGEDGQTAELYAFHYIKKDGNYELAWQMKDGEISCPLDIVTEFIKGGATVTDLDKDGIFETKVQYALACHGDVSPSAMKLILQENKSVYTLQGNRWIKYGPEAKFDVNAKNVNLETLPKTANEGDAVMQSLGRYESEKAFVDAPPEFLEYARNEWLKHVIEK